MNSSFDGPFRPYPSRDSVIRQSRIQCLYSSIPSLAALRFPAIIEFHLRSCCYYGCSNCFCHCLVVVISVRVAAFELRKDHARCSMGLVFRGVATTTAAIAAAETDAAAETVVGVV